LWVDGQDVDWAAMLGDGPRADVPTYAFRHRRFWPRPRTGPAGDASGLGLDGTGHPLIGAAVALPSGDSVFTGKLTARSHPWLPDHAVGGRTVVPGTALVEMALAAGDQVNRPVLDELVLQAPLAVEETGGVPIRVIVTADGALSIHSRSGEDEEWALNATGTLTAGDALAPQDGLIAWPPAGADEIDVTGFYPAAAAGGLEYGPTFQGLGRVWRHDGTVFAEVEIDEPISGYGLHPALFDAALHAIGAGGALPSEGGIRLPFGFTGVHPAPGRPAGTVTALRVAITPAAATDTVRIVLADRDGAPVATVESLALRPVAPAQLGGAADRLLYGIDWVPQRVDGVPAPAITLGDPLPEPVDTLVVDATAPGTALDRAGTLLALLQGWLADPAWASFRLVVRTFGEDPDGAALWGLVRSAQSENPGRIFLLDGPDNAFYPVPQARVRGGDVLVPRLSRLRPGAAPDFGDGTVVVTGATGTLGRLVAEHLVRAHGVREMILMSRSAKPTHIEGASVRAVACDLGDAEAVASALSGERISAVVHAAGVLDDALLTDLTPERLRTVFRAKVDAARNLVAATKDLTTLVFFSSAAGLFGNAGQGNYAAANAFLDAYAEQLRAEGIPATSIVWGLWDAGMGGTLGDAERRRMRAGGIVPLTAEQGLAAFDAALATQSPVVAALGLDPAALGQAAEAGLLPPLLSGLARTPRKTAAPTGPLLGARLAGLAAEDQDRIVLETVQAQVAAVLGHESSSAVPPGRAFQELGFDSLTAVDLRNRLMTVTGLRLPSTLVFDYPNAAALAGHLAEQLRPEVVSPVVALLAELDQLEQGLRATAADDTERSRVTARLAGLLAAWQGGPGGGASLAQELETATDDEMFDLLGKEFGIS
ncbi:type I polyketide synthase, partial [Actinoplanes cyaneus]|uniref:type I polyketide synthase n=1 Tax=Actinoplanes cyaneus TaxID=52696 RepID=UPI0031D93F20